MLILKMTRIEKDYFWGVSLILFPYHPRFLRTWIFKMNISFIFSKIFLPAIPFPVSREYLLHPALLFKEF